jgi:splicing factor 3B subunit 1
MVMETIDSIVEKLGVADVDQKLEEFLIDGILYAFQEQTGEDSHVMLKGFGTVVNSLGIRTKPYLPQICGKNILFFFNVKKKKLPINFS